MKLVIFFVSVRLFQSVLISWQVFWDILHEISSFLLRFGVASRNDGVISKSKLVELLSISFRAAFAVLAVHSVVGIVLFFI